MVEAPALTSVKGRCNGGTATVSGGRTERERKKQNEEEEKEKEERKVRVRAISGDGGSRWFSAVKAMAYCSSISAMTDSVGVTTTVLGANDGDVGEGHRVWWLEVLGFDL